MWDMPSRSVRAAMALLALIGLTGLLPISLADLSDGDACPHLGPLPACHLLSVAYGTVLLTALFRRLWNPWVFFLAWLPIFLFAAVGSGLELTGAGTCPKTEGGIPKCFFSLGLAATLFLLFLFNPAKTRRAGK